MSRPSGEENADDESGGHMAASFTDLMASLMVIFVLLFVATVNNQRQTEKKKRDERRHTFLSDLRDDLRKTLQRQGVDPTSITLDNDANPFALLILMPDDLLGFELDKADVKPAGQAYLRRMVPALTETVCAKSNREKIEFVLVEGHTDTTYRGAGTGDLATVGPVHNLELSQRRSMEVVRWSLAALQNPDARACFRGMVSASGRGQEELDTRWPGTDQRQRRVVFKIRAAKDVNESLRDL